MSINTSETDPDESVLWYWYKNYHQYSTEGTKRAEKSRIRTFERWLASRGDYEHRCHWTDINLNDASREEMVSPANIDEHDAEDFLKDLREAFGGGTQRGIASTISTAYDWCATETKPIDADPIGYVLGKQNKDILDSYESRDAYIIPIEDAQYYVRSWNAPLMATVNLLMAKFTRRAGGVSNLDIEDVHLAHPACQWTPHPDIRHWDDHIVFRHDKSQSEAGRKSGNKTATTAKYPVDDELKDALIWWFAVRPEPQSPDEPLFLDANFERLSTNAISNRMRRKSKNIAQREEGPKCWYGPYDDDNINAHYWRHWATTWYQDRLEKEGLVDYLRGDTGQGSKANYDQYSDVKKNTILETMPKFYEPYIE